MVYQLRGVVDSSYMISRFFWNWCKNALQRIRIITFGGSRFWSVFYCRMFAIIFLDSDWKSMNWNARFLILIQVEYGLRFAISPCPNFVLSNGPDGGYSWRYYFFSMKMEGSSTGSLNLLRTIFENHPDFQRKISISFIRQKGCH